MRIPAMIKQTLMYAISTALMRGISLLMLPFVAHELSTDDFGRLEVIASIAVFASVIAGLGLEDALYRFAGRCHSVIEKKRAASNIFALTLLFGFTLGLLNFPMAQFLSERMPGSISLYAMQLLLATLAMEGIIAVPLGWLRMRDKALSFCLLSVIRVVIQAMLVVIFLKNERGVEGVLEATMIAALIQAMILSYLQIKDSGVKINPVTFRQTLVYSTPLVGSGLLAFGLNGFDRWLIADSLNLDTVAIYGVAAKFSLAAALLIQPYGMWWMPRRFAELNSNDGRTKVQGYSTIGLSLIIFVSLVVGLVSPFVIYWIMPETYHSSIHYLLGLLLVVALREASEFLNIGCFVRDNTNIQFWISIIATVSGVVLMILGIEKFGLLAVIASLAFAQVVRLCLFYYFSQKIIPLGYSLGRIIFLFASTAIVIVSNYLVFLGNPHCILVLGVFFALTVYQFLSLLSHIGVLRLWKLKNVQFYP